ncbi:MAG: FHA domain-containing protein [Planctomycetota bacterium]|jgi:pSer/pThr/pTyr-binding forkhead associated (FHA) protein|nr:FHA domain-containing protein [Planctomycetota bacterium]MDP6941627.1 FHA domain-containing protein [Planctomycetota bacterium]
MNQSKMELEITFDGVTSTRAVAGKLIRVGRSRRCDVTIRDPSISRTHCSLEIRDGGVVLLDEGSANGTWVDGQRTECCRLLPGRSFAIGDSTIRLLEIADSQESISSPAPIEPTASVSSPKVLGDSLARTLPPSTPAPSVQGSQADRHKSQAPQSPPRKRKNSRAQIISFVLFFVLLGLMTFVTKGFLQKLKDVFAPGEQVESSR